MKINRQNPKTKNWAWVVEKALKGKARHFSGITRQHIIMLLDENKITYCSHILSCNTGL